jgi:hypothetical protein
MAQSPEMICAGRGPLRTNIQFRAWDNVVEANPMKTLCIATLLSLATGVMAMAQATAQQKAAPAAPVIKCKNVDARPCTFRQVQGLSDAVFAGKSQHEVLLPVKDLALAKDDGTLRCAQSDGTICTLPELDVIKEIAKAQQLFINYNATATKSGK